MEKLIARLLPSNPRRIAKEFAHLGWIGFWVQAVLAAIPLLVLFYVLFLSSSAPDQRRGIALSEFLAFGSLLVLVFTTVWSYRYTRLATRMANPETRPPKSSVTQTLWIGVGASCLGIVFSILLMISKVGQLLITLLLLPQGGIPTSDPGAGVAAIDMVGLMAQLFTIAGEQTILGISLWLLYRMTQPAPRITYTRAYDHD